MFEAILSFLTASALLAFSPGPDNIYVLTQSIVNGSKAGLATTAGLISGCIVHTTLVAFGMSAIITASPPVFYAIKIAGAIYLVYLAFKVYQSNSEIALQEGAPKKSSWNLFRQGVLMNLLNPKVTIFFLAFFPAFLWAPQDNTVIQFYILGLLFMLVSFIIFSSIALLAGWIAKKVITNPKTGVVLKWLQIVVFVGIAVFLII